MKHALNEMTAAEFRDRLPDEPVILLPLGSQEVQGPHAPMGDYRLAEAVALRAAEIAGAIAAPCLPFGYAEFFRGFPGGVQLRATTFTAVLGDMLGAFLDHGIERLVILNGHSSNGPLIDQVLRSIRREREVAVASIDLWRAIPDCLWTELHGADAARARGHGGDPITSVSSYLFPELMRPDLVQPTRIVTAFDLPASGVAGVRFENAQVNLPLDAHELSPVGMLGGDPSLASSEIGRAIFDHLANYCARFATHFRNCDPRDPVAGPAT